MTNTELERQYARAIGWYPSRWRRTHGPAMLGTLLDMADDEGRTAPVTGELADLRWQGVRERVNAVLPSDGRSFAASIGNGAGGAFAVVYLLLVSWAPAIPRPLPAAYAVADPFGGPFLNAGVLFCVPLLLMTVSALAGGRVLAHVFGAISLLAVGCTTLVVRSTENGGGPSSITLAVVALLVVVANCGDPRRRLSIGGAAAVLAAGLVTSALVRGYGTRWVVDRALWYAVASPYLLSAASVLVAATVVVLLFRRRRALATGIALAWLPWAAAGAVTYWYYEEAGVSAASMVVSSVLVVLATLRTRRAPVSAQSRPL